MKRSRRCRLIGGQRGGQPVDVAGVVDRDDRPAAVRDVLQTEIGDAGPGDRHSLPSRRSPACGRPVPSRYSGAPAGPRSSRRAASLGFPAGLVGVHLVRLGHRRRAAAEPVGHPELAGRMRPVVVLHLLQQVLHARMQQRGQLGRGQRRRDRFADGHRDRHLGPPHVLRMALGPDPLCAPDDVRHDRHVARRSPSAPRRT